MLVVLCKRAGTHILTLGVMGALVLGPENIVQQFVDGGGLFLGDFKSQGLLMYPYHSANSPL